jgi:hypothetical protein
MRNFPRRDMTTKAELEEAKAHNPALGKPLVRLAYSAPIESSICLLRHGLADKV